MAVADKVKVTPLFKSMMNSSDSVLNFNPATDNMMYDHIGGAKFFYGNFKRIHTTQPLNLECRLEFEVEQVSTGLTNRINVHYITTNEQSLQLTIIDMDAILRTNLSDAVILKHAKSYIYPVTKRRLADLIKSGEVKTDEFNVLYEILQSEFDIIYT